VPHRISKTKIATGTAILFHVIGLVGIIGFENDLIIRSTPFNLLLSFALLLWTHKDRNKAFWIFIALVAALGFAAEIIGVHTAHIFGSYQYGPVLGIQWKGVPLVIAVNWVIIIYCCGISIHTLLIRIARLAPSSIGTPRIMKALSVLADGATIATIFDWIMEPVAVKLGFWKWTLDGSIPYYNYFSWFVVSMLLLGIFHLCRFKKRNKFAVNLLLIQLMFFMILRVYLNN
jgi:bisanhydrobacterioruberin hydratase